MSRRPRRSESPANASPLRPALERFLRDRFVKLEREQITPWAFLNSGATMSVTDYYGRKIAYRGVGFEGSPSRTFWSNYIEPFLEQIACEAIAYARNLSSEKRVDPRGSILAVHGLLLGHIRGAYDRMAGIDRRLRGRGFPEKVPLRSTMRELQSMEAVIQRHVAAELQTLPRPPSRWARLNDWVKDRPLAKWLVAPVVALLRLLIRLFGFHVGL